MNIKFKPLSLADARCVLKLLAECGKRKTEIRNKCALRTLEELIDRYGVPHEVELSLRKRDALRLLELILEEAMGRLDVDESAGLISLFDTLEPQISPEHRPDVT